uniref:Uncharacterized protein n=1 Tax=Nelumbo nucifera TaxID=4432 RepID=A0A822YAY9_NELNU|nr:TPA_asm: hypothetical protein HUJ06_029704 [Nelumbo nucifera]
MHELDNDTISFSMLDVTYSFSCTTERHLQLGFAT